MADKPVKREFCDATKQNGRPCRRRAGDGTSHPGYGNCASHFGATPAHVRAAALAIGEEIKVTYGLPIEVDPHVALLEELARTNGHVAWLGHLVSKIDQDDVTYLNAVGVEDTSAIVKLYQSERAHLVKTAKTAIDAGVQEREISLAEAQAQAVVAVITGTLIELGQQITPEVQGIIRRQLTEVASSRAHAA